MITSISNNCRIIKVLAVFLFLAFACAGLPAQEEKNRKEPELENPFGVLEFLNWDYPWSNHKYSSSEDLEKALSLIKESGAGWVRMDFLWSDIEPEPGKFEFAKYDRIVDLAYQNGIRILGLLDYSTDWASSGGSWDFPPKDNRVFVNYVSRVIERYKDKVNYWELWNEPDSATYWKTQDRLKSYCVLLKEVYTKAKAIDPDCKILNGGLASGLSSVNNLYDSGGKGYFDIMNIHIFYNPIYRDAIKSAVSYARQTYKVMSRNGDADKKIWVTEIGCPGVKKGIDTAKWWLGENADEVKQAEWVKEVYSALLAEPFVEKVFWAFFRDTNAHWANGTDYFGLIRWDFSKKPGFYAFQESFKKWKESGKK